MTAKFTCLKISPLVLLITRNPEELLIPYGTEWLKIRKGKLDRI
jgi:hypothetical protein